MDKFNCLLPDSAPLGGGNSHQTNRADAPGTADALVGIAPVGAWCPPPATLRAAADGGVGDPGDDGCLLRDSAPLAGA